MTNHKFASYDNREGVLSISWDQFHGICKGLVQAIYPYNPDIIIGIARGGMYPGTLIAHILQKEFYPVRVTRRFNDEVIYDTPQWRVRPPQVVKGKKILIVDEICGLGRAINMVRNEVEQLQATAVRSAVVYAHTSGAAIPDYIGLISDAVILNPWDIEIYTSEGFAINPEYVYAFEQNHLNLEPAFFPTIEVLEPQKVPC